MNHFNITSVYIQDTGNGQQQVVKEGQSGWVPQAVISRASFRRIPRNGKSYFTMMSLHINNQRAQKRGIGKNLSITVRSAVFQEQVDMVAGDFTLWIRRADQSCHHEVWVHLLHVDARLVDRISRDDKSLQPSFKKRNSPYDHSKERKQLRGHVTIHVKGTCHPCDNTRLP